VRCENLEKLSFDDASIDLHVTQDVFEHLFDPAAAFREIARTLRPGGAHVFTTPLENKRAATEFCARRTPEGEVVQLIEPAQYHGNPISSAGSLVTVRWGYDITQYIFNATGLSTELLVLDNLELGIRAELIDVLITRASR
jgi:SAM-dependent methyltransferase